MTVTSAAGTDLDIDLTGASTVGVWGWTDRPGTLAHWPGGLVVSFPRAATVNGTLVLDRGDINLTFKRYLEAPVRLTLEADHVTRVEGEGADAEMVRGYLAAWGDREAYAVSHVGFGMNRKARYEALAMYDRRDTNGTELRAVAGNCSRPEPTSLPAATPPATSICRSCTPPLPSTARRWCVPASCRTRSISDQRSAVRAPDCRLPNPAPPSAA